MDQFRLKGAVKKPQQQPEGRTAVTPVSNVRSDKKNSNIYILIVAFLLILTLVAGLIWMFIYKTNSQLVGVDSSKNQALFLTNGQVYFGKLSKADGKTVKIENIFYLQVQQDVQPKAEGEQKPGETQLIKLGAELHGPEDSMYIDRSQVLFWENLKNDGKVTQAINQYKK
jgi:hypothetical protein